jgi:hypothetical protein
MRTNTFLRPVAESRLTIESMKPLEHEIGEAGERRSRYCEKQISRRMLRQQSGRSKKGEGTSFPVK